jgi:hypothetical protein
LLNQVEAGPLLWLCVQPCIKARADHRVIPRVVTREKKREIKKKGGHDMCPWPRVSSVRVFYDLLI